MMLYHGTTEEAGKLIMEEGIKVRCNTGAVSNFPNHPSHGNRVYLSNSYAPYFGLNAPSEAKTYALVEIEVTDGVRANLLPDEDYLEQVSRGATVAPEIDKANMTKRTVWFKENAMRFHHMWPESLDGLGTCAHEGDIKRGKIKQIMFIPIEGMKVNLTIDPLITLMNYMIMGERYRLTTQWIAGYGWSWDEFKKGLHVPEKIPDHMKEHFGQMEKYFRRVFCDNELRKIVRWERHPYSRWFNRETNKYREAS